MKIEREPTQPETKNNEVWTSSQLIHQLCLNTLLGKINHQSLGIPVGDLPQEIIFRPEGGLLSHLRQLWQKGVVESSDSPREYGQNFSVYGDLSAFSLVPDQVISGSKREVPLPLKEYTTVISMHVHPIDRPPSPYDFIRVVVNTGAQASLIESFTTRFLLLRTLKTPNLTYEEIAGMANDITKRGYQDYLSSRQQKNDQVGLLNRFFNHKKTRGMIEEQADIQTQIKYVNQICEKFGIALYFDLKKTGRFVRSPEINL